MSVLVEYSTVNYNDCLCICSGGGLVRAYPNVPGIDFAGTVESSDDPRYKAGDAVVEERFETWYGADYGGNRRVDNSPLYVLPSPPRKVMFLRPDVIEKIVNDKPHVLLCKGMYADEYLPATIFEMIKADVETSYFQTPGVWPARLSYFPAS